MDSLKVYYESCIESIANFYNAFLEMLNTITCKSNQTSSNEVVTDNAIKTNDATNNTNT